MNITFLLGNGFDIKLGLRTTYKEFYDYYANVNSDDQDEVKNLKETIRDENWSDLEEAFGKYTKELEDEKQLIDLYNSIINNLKLYLEKEETAYNIVDERKIKNIILNDLITPEQYLRSLEASDILKTKPENDHHYVNIITFNYTNTLERLIDFAGEKIVHNRNINGYERCILSIEHIHGTLSERMVLGVNDFSQISSDKHKESIKIKRRLIKSECNRTYGTGHDLKCINWIKNADWLCLYGLSFGNTDKQWWIQVGNQLLNSNCRLIIFHFDKNITQEGNWGPDFEDAVDDVKSMFLDKTDLDESQKNDVLSRIYVSISSSIFNVELERDFI